LGDDLTHRLREGHIDRETGKPLNPFEETKKELTNILPKLSEQQIETLIKVICEEIDQKKRGQFSEITDLEGKKFKVG